MNKVSRGFIKGNHAPTASLIKNSSFNEVLADRNSSVRSFLNGIYILAGWRVGFCLLGSRTAVEEAVAIGNKDLDPLIPARDSAFR